MNNGKRKTIIFLLSVIIIAGFLSARIVSNSTGYLERKIQRTKSRIGNLIADDYAEWQAFAEAALKEADVLDYRLYRDAYHSNFPQDLDNQVGDLLTRSPVEFDEVYTVNRKCPMPGYPEGCCVFRHTINFSQGVYAWVDLLYVPSEDLQNSQWQQNYSQPPEIIMNGWYVIVFYGY